MSQPDTKKNVDSRGVPGENPGGFRVEGLKEFAAAVCFLITVLAIIALLSILGQMP